MQKVDDIMILTEKNQIPGFITMINSNFVSWIKTLYTNIKSCVRYNSYYSETFNISRSVRQGYPIPALLFILVAEILAICIRQNNDIQGITLCNTTFKIVQLADDTTLFLSHLGVSQQQYCIIQVFLDFSGLRPNLDKTEIIPICKNVGKNIILLEDQKELRYKTSAFKTLEIWLLDKESEKKIFEV